MPLFEAKPRWFYIQLLNNQQVFFSGFPVSGVVMLDLVEPKRTRGVFVQLIGIAQTEWRETVEHRKPNGEIERRQVTRTETVELYNSGKMPVWAPPAGQPEAEMMPGSYTLPFSFALPPSPGFPATFSGRYGSISYVLKANIDRPWKFDHKCYRPVTLLPLLDSNMPQFLTSMRREDEKTSCCCCCASGPIIVSAEIPRCGWCPGEVVPFNVQLKNCGNREIRGITCDVRQRIEYVAGSHSRQEQNRLLSVSNSQTIPAGGTFSGVIMMRMPATCPTIHRMYSRLIDVSYSFVVTAQLPFGSFDLRLRLPIEVTTIPYAGPVAASAPPPTWATPQGIVDMASHCAAPSAPSVQPPTYDDVYQEGEPTSTQINQGHQVNYVYFPVPEPSAPPAITITTGQGASEKTPLVGGSISAASTAAGQAAASAPPMTMSLTFAAPCAATPVEENK